MRWLWGRRQAENLHGSVRVLSSNLLPQLANCAGRRRIRDAWYRIFGERDLVTWQRTLRGSSDQEEACLDSRDPLGVHRTPAVCRCPPRRDQAAGVRCYHERGLLHLRPQGDPVC